MKYVSGSTRNPKDTMNQLARNVAGDEAGLTLVEVMLVSVIMMVLALGMATFLENSRKAIKRHTNCFQAL